MIGTFAGVTQSRLPTGVWHQTYSGVNSCTQFPALSSRQCNFTSESFTVAVWIFLPNSVSANYVILQGATDVDGWGMFIFANNLSLRLNQAAGHTDISAVNGIAFGRWQLIGVTRAGNTGQFYNNGAPITTIGGGGLANAVSCNGGNKLLLGIDNDETSNEITGFMQGHRIIRKSLSDEEMAKMFESERRLFGV
ncbi:MAG: LamG-like jellyroll fold domain-containing protein [Chloroflexota bacterium]